MQQVRFGFFETNSSSTHVLAILPEKIYSKWYSDFENWEDEVFFVYLSDKEQVETLRTGADVLKRMQEDPRGEYWKKSFNEADNDYDKACVIRSYARYSLGWYSSNQGEMKCKKIGDDKVAVSIYIDE